MTELFRLARVTLLGFCFLQSTSFAQGASRFKACQNWQLQLTQNSRSIEVCEQKNKVRTSNCGTPTVCARLQRDRSHVSVDQLSRLDRPRRSALCFLAQGRNLILEDKDKNQIDFCQFADGSGIVSQDLENFVWPE